MSRRFALTALAVVSQVLLSGYCLRFCVTSPIELSEAELAVITGSKIPGEIVWTGNPCKTLQCYSAGGHGFKCQDSHVNESINPETENPLQLNIGSTICTPLWRYAFTDCTGFQDVAGDCDWSRTAVSDP